MNGLGRGRPHSPEAFRQKQGLDSTPTMTALQNFQEQFLYVVSMEFAIGNLDALKDKEGRRR